MDNEEAFEFLKNTDKPILYKKGRYGKKILILKATKSYMTKSFYSDTTEYLKTSTIF